MIDDEGSRRALIREWRLARQRRIVVLDDDPTGSQSVHDVQIVVTLSDVEIALAWQNRLPRYFFSPTLVRCRSPRP